MVKEGFASLAEGEQIRRIRSIYPKTSEEEIVLIRLLQMAAIDKKSAVPVTQSQGLAKLIEAEHILRTDDRKYYLTTDAQLIAKGALSIYPKLNRLDG